MESKIPSFLLKSSPLSAQADHERRGGGRVNISYLEKGIRDFAELFTEGHAQWELSLRKGFLHALDARIKIVFWLYFVIVISLKHEIMPEAAIFMFLFLVAVCSRLSLGTFYKKVVMLGFVFGFLVSAPSALNIIVPGKIAMPVLVLSRPHEFWIYHIPQVIGITEEGISIVSLLTLRVLNSLSVSFLVLYSTPFADIVKALKVFRVPDTFLLIISMTYKYIFSFAHIVSDMHLAKKARLAGDTRTKEAGAWAAGRIASVFRKTQMECDEVFKAMAARGFSGRLRFYHYRKLTFRDWATGLCLFMAGFGFLII
ncbi:MAG TPA: energy-coupling factor transporter transmembrane component T [Dissulfurispiraceae bacterium]|nr:energy-coupling factor transporter transmembrane component T [Dissulfurispiraceae bacterium]